MPDQNYKQIRYGNNDGELRFGYIDTLQNKHAFTVRSGASAKHYLAMVASPGGDVKSNSHLNNGTILNSPGSLQLNAGSNVDSSFPGVFIDANSGELILKSNSNVRIMGKNVFISATGGDDPSETSKSTSNGMVTIKANEKVHITGQQGVRIDSAATLEIVSSNSVRIIADGILKVFGNMVEFADGASTALTGKGSKIDPTGVIKSTFETEMSLRGG